MSKSNELLEKLFNSIILGDIQKAREISRKVVNKGLSVTSAQEKIREAMRIVDEKYERKEYFIVDVASAASAMREAFNVFKPYLQGEPVDAEAKVVVGSLMGNIQGLGKDIVVATLRAAGFEVVDLGVNVRPELFVDTAIQEKAQTIAISISVKETAHLLREVVDYLRKRKFDDKVKIVIGGQGVSEKTCKEYEIDAYAKDAWDCVKKVKKLLAR